MKTTELFVELIVIGYGVIIWLIFLIMSIFGYSWLNLDYINSAQILLPSLIGAYVLGILIDRISDWIFRKWEKNIRQNKLKNLKNCYPDFDYQRARTIVYDQSESLRSWFYYGRSRVRICRGWAINFFLMLINVNFFISFQCRNGNYNISIFITLIFTLLWSITVFSWYRLTSSEYERLSQEHASITNDITENSTIT